MLLGLSSPMPRGKKLPSAAPLPPPAPGNPLSPSVQDLGSIGWLRQLDELQAKLDAELHARVAAELALAFKQDEVDEQRARAEEQVHAAEEADRMRLELLALQRKLDEEQQRAANLQDALQSAEAVAEGTRPFKSWCCVTAALSALALVLLVSDIVPVPMPSPAMPPYPPGAAPLPPSPPSR